MCILKQCLALKARSDSLFTEQRAQEYIVICKKILQSMPELEMSYNHPFAIYIYYLIVLVYTQKQLFTSPLRSSV